MDLFEQIRDMCDCCYVSDLHQESVRCRALSCLQQVKAEFSPQEVSRVRRYILQQDSVSILR